MKRRMKLKKKKKCLSQTIASMPTAVLSTTPIIAIIIIIIEKTKKSVCWIGRFALHRLLFSPITQNLVIFRVISLWPNRHNKMEKVLRATNNTHTHRVDKIPNRIYYIPFTLFQMFTNQQSDSLSLITLFFSSSGARWTRDRERENSNEFQKE